MNSKNAFKLCARTLSNVLITRNAGDYKVINRPDPKSLKMPSAKDAPKIMDILKEKIRLSGPMTVADFMHVVVTNPTEGYYMKKEVIGEDGDFITSPEISQLFGEMVAIWFCAESSKLGPPATLQLVELGPGKGTLMVDMLRVMNQLGRKTKDLSIHLVEISETMRQVQANRLCAHHRATDPEKPYYYEGETVSGIPVYWYNDLKKVPMEFSWYIAHEFFDVLPIHKFQKTPEGWREVLIDIDSADQLSYRISGAATAAVSTLIRPPLDTGDRTELEISARGLGVARQLAERVDRSGGVALVADYGHDGDKGDTFRAFLKHQLVDPLAEPGRADLTADVDFAQLRIAASRTPSSENYALVLGPVTQAAFLRRARADVRLQVLLDNAKTEEAKERLRKGYEMLTDPAKMGERFKFMAFYPSAMAEFIEKHPPLGFSSHA